MLSLIRIVILINSTVSTFYSPFVLFIFSHVLIVTSVGKAGGLPRSCEKLDAKSSLVGWLVGIY